ncbi:MAG: DUF4180 domain-containing protein [Clostridia bacterium]|nr:DUF4180 domain-containing protein [Clostridia bacterium]
MEYRVSQTEPRRIEILSSDPPLDSESASMDWVALCWEHDVTRLLVHDAALGDAFYQLKTKVAGAVIQKMVNYGIRMAVVIGDTPRGTAHFHEMQREANQGPHFRVFGDVEAASRWLDE